MIAARGLRKRYGTHEALRGVDLDVRRSEILAILGPNGAGKTTLIEILAGFRTRDAGELTVLSEDPATAGRAWRERIGVVLQESAPDPDLTVRECLDLYAGYYRAPREPAELIDIVGLTDSADQRAETLSGGQRRDDRPGVEGPPRACVRSAGCRAGSARLRTGRSGASARGWPDRPRRT